MLSRIGQANHSYITAGYAALECGFPQSSFHKVRERLVVRKILIFDDKTKSFHFARRKLLQNREGSG